MSAQNGIKAKGGRGREKGVKRGVILALPHSTECKLFCKGLQGASKEVKLMIFIPKIRRDIYRFGISSEIVFQF